MDYNDQLKKYDKYFWCNFRIYIDNTFIKLKNLEKIITLFMAFR